MESHELLEIETWGDTKIVIWSSNVDRVAYHKLEEAMDGVLGVIEKTKARNVIIDLERTKKISTAALRYSSAALGFYVRLWARVDSIGGRMAMCNVTPSGVRVLEKNRLDSLWTVYDSRQDAMDAFENS